MKKTIAIFIILLVFAGCATVPVHYNLPVVEHRRAKFIQLSNFCKEHKLYCFFDNLGDNIALTAPGIDVKLLLASHFVLLNGRIISMDNVPYYAAGRIFIPRQLGLLIYPASPLGKILPLMSIKTIVIDSGHGGKDPGAISPHGLKEKYVTLSIARYLRKDLVANGFKVYLTRDKDIYLTLRARVEFARKHNADLFISIHANSNPSRRIRGVEVYYLSSKYFDSESKAVVLAENSPLRSGGTGDLLSKDTQRIVWDLKCTENNIQSLDFARMVVSTLQRMGFKARPPRGAPFYVLKYARTPSVLIEAGYLTNAYEEKLLRSPYYQKQIAHGIALSVRRLNWNYAKRTHLSL